MAEDADDQAIEEQPSMAEPQPELEPAPQNADETQKEQERRPQANKYRQNQRRQDQSKLDQGPQNKGTAQCNQRIAELAQPNRRQYLNLWNDHSYHFPIEKCKKLRRMLQEMYAMTPEEAQKYFEHLRLEAKSRARRRRIKNKIKAYLKMKRVLRQRQQAYKHLWRLIRALLHYALHHEPPAIMSARLMIISNVILEQLCDILDIDTLPDRTNPDRYDEFLIRIADWGAIAAENLYYQTQLAISYYMNDFDTTNAPDPYQDMGPDPVEPPGLAPGQTMVDVVLPEPDELNDDTVKATQAG